jgi:hypothetical protein
MIKNCDTFFRHLSLRVGRRKKLSRRLSSADVALDSEADLHSCFEARQDDKGPDETRNVEGRLRQPARRSRHARGTLTRGRGNQQERSVYLLIAKGLCPTQITYRD